LPKIVVNDIEVECKLVLFDLDGTLVDESFRYRSLAKARMATIEEMAGTEAANRWAELSGVDPETFIVDPRGPLSKAPRKEDVAVATAALWLNKMNWFKAKEIALEAYSKADDQQSTEYKPELIKGIYRTLKDMKKTGLLLGIATNGSGKTAREIMEAIGVDSLFDVFIGADEVNEGKPSPDMILVACRRLGVRPEDAVYVGDEVTDAIAGNAANCKATIIVDAEEDVSDLTQLTTDSVSSIKAEK
jgi:phosphoglycolate phosphatase